MSWSSEMNDSFAGSSFTIAAFFLAFSSISAGLVTWDVFPPFTEEAALPINLVQVYDATGHQSYISLSSLASGRSLEDLVAGLGTEFNVSTGIGPDFVTYEVRTRVFKQHELLDETDITQS